MEQGQEQGKRSERTQVSTQRRHSQREISPDIPMGPIPLWVRGQGRPAENLNSSKSRSSGTAFLLKEDPARIFLPGSAQSGDRASKVNGKLFKIKLSENLLLVKNSYNLLILTSDWIFAKHFLS